MRNAEYYERIQEPKKLHNGGLSAQEHVRCAELLAGGTWIRGAYIDSWEPPTEYAMKAAQVHATLAVARAAIEARTSGIEAPEIRPVVPR